MGCSNSKSDKNPTRKLIREDEKGKKQLCCYLCYLPIGKSSVKMNGTYVCHDCYHYNNVSPRRVVSTSPVRVVQTSPRVVRERPVVVQETIVKSSPRRVHYAS